MASGASEGRRERLELVADGCLITATAVALAISLSFVPQVLGLKIEDNRWIEALSAALFFAGGLAGPIAAWLLHRRRVSLVAVVGGFVGSALVGFAVMGVALIAALFGLILRPFTTSEFAGPIALLVLLVAGFLAVAVWLVVDSVRDFVPERRAHKVLDIVRVASFLGLVAYGSVTTVVMLGAKGEGDFGDPAAFVLAASIYGAAIVFGADQAEWLWARSKAGKAGPVASEDAAVEKPAEAAAPEAPEPEGAAPGTSAGSGHSSEESE